MCDLAASVCWLWLGVAAAAPPQNPFLPGRPLEPWTGPTPAHGPFSHALDAPPAAEPDRQSPSAQESPPTYVTAVINPALVTFGKIGGRVEVAPLAAHALFFEVSKISLRVEERDVELTAKGWEYDLGYHLFPQGDGARGFYLGPRYARGHGSASGVTGSFWGVGADLGYAWVIARHIVINLGAGAAYVHGKAEIDDAVIDELSGGVPDEAEAALGGLSTRERALWIPMVTVGLGFAI